MTDKEKDSKKSINRDRLDDPKGARHTDLRRQAELALEEGADKFKLFSKQILMAVDICREQGGNLSDLLEGMSDDLREIHGIDEKVQSLTAGGRLQAKLLAISPFVLGAMMYFAQPEMQESFYGSIAGKGLTVLAILLTVGGFLWMKKIVKF